MSNDWLTFARNAGILRPTLDEIVNRQEEEKRHRMENERAWSNIETRTNDPEEAVSSGTLLLVIVVCCILFFICLLISCYLNDVQENVPVPHNTDSQVSSPLHHHPRRHTQITITPRSTATRNRTELPLPAYAEAVQNTPRPTAPKESPPPKYEEIAFNV